MLLKDNRLSHVSDEILAFLNRAHMYVIIITFTLHTMHIFQILDMMLFDVLKMWK
jgi:hypothetical protein